MKRSRLLKNTEKKSSRNLVLSILGIVLILFLLFRYGIPLISDASFLFGRITGRILGTPVDNQKSSEDENYVPSPEIDPLPKAVKDQEISISGTSLSGLSVILYLNGSREDETEVNEDGSFQFSVTLTDGENIIKAKAIKNNVESEFSNPVVVNYKKTGPQLTIDSPTDGQTVSDPNPFNVTGKTDEDAMVSVNDFQAIISGDTWSYSLTLKDGENEIKVIATDFAGNKTEKIIKINYSP